MHIKGLLVVPTVVYLDFVLHRSGISAYLVCHASACAPRVPSGRLQSGYPTDDCTKFLVTSNNCIGLSLAVCVVRERKLLRVETLRRAEQTCALHNVMTLHNPNATQPAATLRRLAACTSGVMEATGLRGAV